MHPLLQKQIDKYLKEVDLQSEAWQAFLSAVHDSYSGFERDKKLMQHAFEESEKEFIEVNQSLASHLQLQQQSHQSLMELVAEFEQHSISNEATPTDLLALTAHIKRLYAHKTHIEGEYLAQVELLKTLMTNLQSGILVEDEQRKIVFTNQLFCDMFGIPVPPEALLGADCADSAEQTKMLFAQPEQFVLDIHQLLERRQIATQDILEMADGRVLERDYIPIFIDNVYRGHMWRYQDVTTRFRLKEQLAQSELRNRLIMDAALNAIVSTDIQGVITYWNRRAEVIFGWEALEVLGLRLTDCIIPAVHHQAHQKGMERFMATGQSQMMNQLLELPALCKNGQLITVELSITPITIDDQMFFCAFIQDISERKQAEKALRFQQQKYQNIIANMNLGLIEVDNAEHIVYCNQSFAEISGYSVDELMGKRPSDLFVLGENKGVVEEKIKTRMAGQSDIYQLPIKNKSGDLRWWAISGAPNYDSEGQVSGSIGIHLDITAQKEMEFDLAEQKANAERLAASKEVFLANMSHEIRTPLNAIVGFLRELKKSNLSDAQRQWIDNSHAASNHLMSIINNVLDISKIEAGEMSLHIKDVSLSDIIYNSVQLFVPKANEKGLDLRIKGLEKLSQAYMADEVRLEQILINLIGNAIKFTHQGQVLVETEVLDKQIKHDVVRIRISDTGIGMSEAFVSRIFDKFQQEDVRIARSYEGTGLGMTITKELLELMEGTIQIFSEKNKGTQIEITLQLKMGNPQKITTSDVGMSQVSLKGLQILLVEDNELNRMVAQNTLQQCQCEVYEAENGKIALEYVQSMTFDVILMDIQMPELDGIETVRLMRQTLDIQTPVIALTANAFKTEVEKCFKAGMNDYITKPFDESHLIRTIAKHTQRWDEHKQKPTYPLVATPSKPYQVENLRKLSRGDEAFVTKMIELFVQQTREVTTQWRIAEQQGQWDQVSRLAHKLIPSVDMLGIEAAVPLARQIEKWALHPQAHPNLSVISSQFLQDLNDIVDLMEVEELSQKRD